MHTGGPRSDWLHDWVNIRIVAHSLLYDHAKSICPKPKYVLQTIAGNFSTSSFLIDVLFFSVAYLELNLISIDQWRKLISNSNQIH